MQSGRRVVTRCARPFGAESFRQFLVLLLAGPGEDEDPRVRELVPDGLDEQVRRGAKAEETEDLAILRFAIAAP
jgi:hypothetical protein